MAIPHTSLQPIAHPGRVLVGRQMRRIQNRNPLSCFVALATLRKDFLQLARLWRDEEITGPMAFGLAKQDPHRIGTMVRHGQIRQRGHDKRGQFQGHALVTPDMQAMGHGAHFQEFLAAELFADRPADAIEVLHDLGLGQISQQPGLLLQIHIGRAQPSKPRIGRRGQQAGAVVLVVKARCHVRGMHGVRRDFSAAQRAARSQAALPPGGMLSDKFFGTDESLRAGVNGGSWHFGFSAQAI